MFSYNSSLMKPLSGSNYSDSRIGKNKIQFPLSQYTSQISVNHWSQANIIWNQRTSRNCICKFMSTTCQNSLTVNWNSLSLWHEKIGKNVTGNKRSRMISHSPKLGIQLEKAEEIRGGLKSSWFKSQSSNSVFSFLFGHICATIGIKLSPKWWPKPEN